ncbi:MAG: hypothetical protein Q8M83_04150 [bacterium]|nr:hypothetical protein [bacterium]
MSKLSFGPRRAVVLNVKDEMNKSPSIPLFKRGKHSKPHSNPLITKGDIEHFEFFDLLYRTLCAVLYNYVPTSGHPGGSISSGRFVAGLLFKTADYDFSNPHRPEADIVSYAAGHKALGLYAMWALRNEVARAGKPALLPKEIKNQLRLEDLLGFRRNPVTATPLFLKYKSKALDGHPSPATPFIKISTGASGFGVCSSAGLAVAALDFYGGKSAPYVHAIEGEGGMTPGRVSEAFAFASAAGLKNFVVHLDWNQASIDSNHVTREGNIPGDYVQWDPMEFAYLHDWNVIIVPDGKDFAQVFAGQELLKKIKNSQPTIIVYRTIKGWKYGIEGRASHGAGHKFCSEGYYESLKELEKAAGVKFPRFSGEETPANLEKYYFATLLIFRKILASKKETAEFLADKIFQSRDRLKKAGRQTRASAPKLEDIYNSKKFKTDNTPVELRMKAGESIALRAALAKVLNFYNRASGGAILSASADLSESTSVSKITEGFPQGFFHAVKNPGSRLLAVGGICEDAIGGVISGISAFGKHIGVGSSYAAFIAALHHIAMRLHGIGQQAKVAAFGGQYNPFITICGHAGFKTGEDGPTHADPQALQLLQENFPAKVMITLTPWDPQELWPLMTAALQARPCVIAPFVTRPNEKVLDRQILGLTPASAAAQGVYLLKKAKASVKCHGAVILQGSDVAYAFLQKALPKLEAEKLNLNIYYISSAELFDLLPAKEQEKILPEKIRQTAIGITGFTLPTLYRFITSERGRQASLHPFKNGHYPGSGQADKVLQEAGLDGESQYKAIKEFFKC